MSTADISPAELATFARCCVPLLQFVFDRSRPSNAPHDLLKPLTPNFWLADTRLRITPASGPLLRVSRPLDDDDDDLDDEFEEGDEDEDEDFEYLDDEDEDLDEDEFEDDDE